MNNASLRQSFDILVDNARDDQMHAKYLLKEMLKMNGIHTEDELRKYFTLKVLEGSVSREGATATINTIINNGWLK